MKKGKIVAMILAFALAIGVMSGCSAGGGGGGSVEKSYWSVNAYIDTTWGAEMNVSEAYQLDISGDSYQLTRTQKTTQDVWVDITYYGALFGTCTVSESGDNLVYKLNAPTRGIYANGQIEAVTTSIEPVMMDSDDNSTWPETLDGENAPSKDAIIAMAFGTGCGLGETVGSITVTVSKAGGQILSVTAG